MPGMAVLLNFAGMCPAAWGSAHHDDDEEERVAAPVGRPCAAARVRSESPAPEAELECPGRALADPFAALEALEELCPATAVVPSLAPAAGTIQAKMRDVMLREAALRVTKGTS